MLRRMLTGLLVMVLVIGAFAAVGGLAYRSGLLTGLAQQGKVELVTPPAGAPVYAYGPGWGHPWGFGFGPLACLGPILFLMVFFGFMRLIFGRRHWGWGHRHGPWGHGPWSHGPQDPGMGVPPMFEAWHKQAHGQSAAGPADPPPSA